LLFKKYQYARYFVFAWSFYLIMYGVSILRLTGFLPSSYFTYYGIQIGSAVEMLVLSFAIGHKLYEYKIRSDKMVQDAIEHKKKINLELTKLVEEKTNEISNNYRLIEKDIEMARNMQLNTLPKNIDWSKYNLELSTFFLPKDRVSGDIYDVCNFDEDRLRIFIADATGHGIQAGFFTMSIRTEYERIKYEHSDTSQVLRLLNQSVFQTFGNETMLYSCFIIDIDLSQNYFVYSSAGHPEQFLFQNNELMELRSLGPILGFKKDLSIKSKSIPIVGDFKLFLYSDGITEVHDKDINEFGTKRIIEMLTQDKDINGNDLLFNVFSEASEFGSEIGLEDDITMIYIRSIK
ncbi:MAG: SpoIIE family protein phosphatase, partial [Leptospira sp.]|nr:SpoIIE family protein phosphatase [Leptospira sp.]